MPIRKIPILVLASAGCLALLYGLILPLTQTPVPCTDGQPIHQDMEHSTNASLQKLAALEGYCQGAVSSQMMLFAPMPKTEADVAEFAASMIHELQEFEHFSITPLVVFEPDIQTPDIMQQLAAGDYDAILDSYYNEIKQYQISDKQMGTWVILPEANTPTWKITDPDIFKTNVKKIAKLHKKYFPNSHLSLLLDAYTYPDNDSTWTYGKLADLSPYVTTLPKNLIDSIGLQGFPRKAPKNEPDTTTRITASTFLPVQLLREAAQKLDISSVWLNTGTFGAMYIDNPAAHTELTPKERRDILSDILTQAESLASKNITVTINIFAEDKSLTQEHVDWSYPEISQSNTQRDSLALKPFLSEAHKKKLTVSLYDN